METSVALDFLGELRRTHSVAQLRASDEGKTVMLMGWVHRRRDHGRRASSWTCATATGMTQVVFHEDVGPAVHKRAEEVRPEYVIAVEGKVALRGPGAVNPNLATGEIEVVAARHLDSQRIAHAAVPHGRRGRRQRRRAPEVPLRGSAPAAHAAQHHAALEDRHSRCARLCTRRAFWKSKRPS